MYLNTEMAGSYILQAILVPRLYFEELKVIQEFLRPRDISIWNLIIVRLKHRITLWNLYFIFYVDFILDFLRNISIIYVYIKGIKIYCSISGKLFFLFSILSFNIYKYNFPIKRIDKRSIQKIIYKYFIP